MYITFNTIVRSNTPSKEHKAIVEMVKYSLSKVKSIRESWKQHLNAEGEIEKKLEASQKGSVNSTKDGTIEAKSQAAAKPVLQTSIFVI